MSSFTLDKTLTTREFYILMSVTDRDLHGYAIRDQIANDSEGDLILAMGTIYPALRRLVQAKLLERIDTPGERAGIVARYRITPVGRKRFDAELRRLERVLKQARYKQLPQRVSSTNYMA